MSVSACECVCVYLNMGVWVCMGLSVCVCVYVCGWVCASGRSQHGKEVAFELLNLNVLGSNLVASEWHFGVGGDCPT